MFFDLLTDILFRKKKKYIKYYDEQLEFQNFMLQRWCSMLNRDNILIINETTNKWMPDLFTKNMLYKFYLTILPAVAQKKVAYIKKSSNSIDKDNMICLSKDLELSVREIQEYKKLIELLK
jgi:hypothetical protein